MALRTATLQSVRREPITAADWELRVHELADAARAALQRRDAAAVAGALRDARGLADRNRAYQATRHLVEIVFGTPNAQGDLGWLELYAAAAGELLTSLEAEPREPVLLNYAGVLLYELTENAAAKALFRAALRLDPELPHVRDNLAALKGRRSNALEGRVAAAAKTLAARAARVATAARPAEGLTLSVCLIVKDEEEMLPGCLEPLAGVADELVVVDTGSTDRTREIAESFGARVVEFPWNGSFADARNVSLETATGDWILWVDADEHWVAEDAPRLRELLGRTWREGFRVVETNFTGSDDSGVGLVHTTMRLFRNRPQHRFEGRIHEQILASLPTYLPERFEATTLRMLHYGYLKERHNARDKSRRNLELLEAEEKQSPTPFTWFNLGSEYLAIGELDRGRSYLERAWNELTAKPDWHTWGFAPLLARRLASACRVVGDRDAARGVIAAGLAALPDHTDLILELAVCTRADGDLDEAASLLERCLVQGDAPARYSATVGTGTFLALCELAGIRADQGRLGEAEELYRRSLADHPSFGAPLLPLAALVLARGGAPEEVEALVVEDRPSAHMLVATALYEAGFAAEAERGFRRTLERQPHNPVALVGLVESLLSQRRYDEAGEAAAAVPADSPVAGAAAAAQLFAAAAAADAAGLRDALDHGAAGPGERLLFGAWLQVIEGGDPGRLPASTAPAVETCLEALLRVQEFGAFEQLVAVYGRIAQPEREQHERLARLYLRRGFLDSAADEWIAVARTAPDAAALVGLAQVAHARGLADDARAFAAEAVRLDPFHPEATRLADALERQAA